MFLKLKRPVRDDFEIYILFIFLYFRTFSADNPPSVVDMGSTPSPSGHWVDPPPLIPLSAKNTFLPYFSRG